jgi:DNA-binding Lrp family transcriptional regulator
MAETEKFTLKSEDVVKKIKELIKEGNIRRIRLIHDGKTIFDIPLSVGAGLAAVGIIWAPVLAAIGAFAALVSDVTIEVEKTAEKK